MSEGLDDRALLAAHLEGDAEAFGVLFARHRDRLWAVALRTTGDPEEAADALQDAMISAFRRAESYRGDAAVTTWLHRVVVNACFDRLRRRKVRLTEPLPDDHQSGHDLREPDRPGPVDPADAAVAGERRSAVLAALESLPTEQRAALVLVDMEGFTVEETAAILGCAAGTVKSRCSRGRARLAPLLAGLAPGGRSGNPPEISRVPLSKPGTRAATSPRGSPAEAGPAPAGPGTTPSEVDEGGGPL